MAKKLIKMWVMPEMKANLIVKQQRLKQDFGKNIPLCKIAYAMSRQPLIADVAGVDFSKMGKRGKKFVR